MEKESLERERLKFEREKSERDFQLREREFALKEQESNNNRSKITSTQVTIWVALFGLLSTGLGVWLQGRSNQKLEMLKFESNLKLEKLKFESEIIYKVATSDSIERNKKNLKFFLSTGVLSDEQGKISRVVNEKSFDLKIEPANNKVGTFRDKYFQYYDMPLQVVIYDIERWYSVSFMYDYAVVAPVRLTIERASKDLPLSAMLKIITKASGVKFLIVGRSVGVLPGDVQPKATLSSQQ
jgi:hypothetical protein